MDEFEKALDAVIEVAQQRRPYYHDYPNKRAYVLSLHRAALEDAKKYRALATPEISDFLKAVEREALHQRDRWGVEHDAGKADSDWFWLIGFLAGKALHKPEKMLHHIITTAAACLNWHAARVSAHTAMRPGISGEGAVMAPKPNHDAALAQEKVK